MGSKLTKNSLFIRLRDKVVKETSSKTTLILPDNQFSTDLEISQLKIQSRSLGVWNPFDPPEPKDICMICWKPLDLQGKDARSFMECRHCHRKAHQQHMLRWLSRKNHCPYCQNKW